MPKSKNRKDHKQKLQKFKSNRRIMNENAQQLPPVRSLPVWDPNVNIQIKGFEWEAIQNGLASLNFAMQASQSVMSRNILSGDITMDFEKLDPATGQYLPMTADEKAPHLKQFAEQIEAFKTAQANATATPATPADAAPATGIVTPEGQPAVSETATAKPKRKAKVIPMDGSK